MNKFREFLQGKKTYLTAAIGIVSALIAYGDGAMDTTALVAAILGAITACMLRAGMNNSAK